MQTLVQIESFFGALISGYLLTRLDYKKLILCLCIFDIVISILGNFIYKEQAHSEVDNNKVVSESGDVTLSRTSKILCYSIGLIGIHICAFNTLTPISFQEVKGLGAGYYGMCSGAAGVGAFVAAFIDLKKYKFLFPALTLTIADILFTFSSVTLLAVAACFIIGFSMNTFRINLRKEMIDQANNNTEANAIEKYSATVYMFTQSIGPLALGMLTSSIIFGVDASSYLFPLIGASVFIFLDSTQRDKSLECMEKPL